MQRRVLNKGSFVFILLLNKEGIKMEKFKAKTERILEKGEKFYKIHPYISTYLVMVSSSMLVELFAIRCMYKFRCFDE